MTDHEGLCPETELGDHDALRAAHPHVLHTSAVPEDDEAPRGGCRTHLQGWAGAHLHGAVRPRLRKTKRGRPPGRWC